MDFNSSTTPRSVAGPNMNGGPADPTREKNRWRSPAREKIYGQKLAGAIAAARASAGTAVGGAAIKDAADSALAIAARGQTRWSRAILARQWRRRKLLVRVGGKIRSRRKTARPAPAPPPGLSGSGKDGEKVRERLRQLSRLVPGCRELPAPALLEEAADYVAAMQMQVRAMRSLVDRFSAATAIDGS